MKKSFLLAGALSAALASYSAVGAAPVTAPAAPAATAATAAPPAPATPPQSEFIDAMTAAGMELQAEFGADDDMAKAAERYRRFEFTPATKKKLLAVFGSEHPFELSNTPLPKGGDRTVMTLPAHTYQSPGGSNVEWSTLNISAVRDKGDKKRSVAGEWSSLIAVGQELTVTVRDMSYAGTLTRGPGDLWYGKQHGRVGGVMFDSMAGAGGANVGPFWMRGIDFDFDMVQRGKVSNMAYRFGIESLSVAEQQIDRINMATRVLNMNTASLAEFNRELKELNKRKLPATEKQLAMLEVMKRFGKTLIKQGATLEIDDLSAGYKGNKFALKGSFTFKQVVDADFDAPIRLLKKLVARAEVRLPLALLNDVSAQLARKQLATRSAEPSFEAEVSDAAKNIANVVIGKLVGEGYARIEKGELRSVVVFKDGKLVVNGKPITLPLLDALMDGPITPASELPGKCHWPEFPAEAAAKNLTLQYDIGADGRAGKIVVVQGSGVADFDAAAIAGVKACQWTPANKAGKAIGSPMTHNFRRSYPALPPGVSVERAQ
ncbi:DUF945 family protein [Rugamonas sp. CCM 8940]|uniref:DUF945 family protein n=1 Tax=Rugamonas sp. CCM 8940 TaxID=2765359 RepID=UPI0018F32D50|nr:DUF945 family protein [Rugamonas sp. CCM 8940]MBJ7313904.1 DUF945 family protein [Rugamonas sp. CCM 8940]